MEISEGIIVKNFENFKDQNQKKTLKVKTKFWANIRDQNYVLAKLF